MTWPISCRSSNSTNSTDSHPGQYVAGGCGQLASGREIWAARSGTGPHRPRHRFDELPVHKRAAKRRHAEASGEHWFAGQLRFPKAQLIGRASVLQIQTLDPGVHARERLEHQRRVVDSQPPVSDRLLVNGRLRQRLDALTRRLSTSALHCPCRRGATACNGRIASNSVADQSSSTPELSCTETKSAPSWVSGSNQKSNSSSA